FLYRIGQFDFQARLVFFLRILAKGENDRFFLFLERVKHRESEKQHEQQNDTDDRLFDKTRRNLGNLLARLAAFVYFHADSPLSLVAKSKKNTTIIYYIRKRNSRGFRFESIFKEKRGILTVSLKRSFQITMSVYPLKSLMMIFVWNDDLFSQMIIF